MDNRTEAGKQRVGTTDEGFAFIVTLTKGTASGTSVTHEPVTDERAVAFVGEVINPRVRNKDSDRYYDGMGQCQERLADITKPAAGWTMDEVRELHTIWDRWHLNDMRAACAHMDPATLAREERNGQQVIATGAINTCPVSDYTYGHAWLIEPIPQDVIDRIDHLLRNRDDALFRERGYDAGGNRYPKDREDM